MLLDGCESLGKNRMTNRERKEYSYSRSVDLIVRKSAQIHRSGRELLRREAIQKDLRKGIRLAGDVATVA